MIQRRKRTPLKRNQKPIAKKRATPRRGPMRDPQYRKFLRNIGYCPVCFGPAWVVHGAFVSRFTNRDVGECIDPAHTENNGMRSKGPDSSCAPLCRVHHEEYDAGRKAFEEKYEVSMKDVAAKWYALYLEQSQ